MGPFLDSQKASPELVVKSLLRPPSQYRLFFLPGTCVPPGMNDGVLAAVGSVKFGLFAAHR